MTDQNRQFAIVTGASSGIGLELAKQFAANGFDLLLAADRPLQTATQEIQSASPGVAVDTLECDLSTREGVAQLVKRATRPVDALAANAGIGLGHAFLEQDWSDIDKLLDTNIVGTLLLLHKVGRDMRSAGNGRILITGSIAGFLPGTYQAVYNATKAFLDSFSFALRHELKDTGVSVTCLMPGVTETDFFETAGMTDTKAGSGGGDDPADVAKTGFDAMMAGKGDVVAGWQNKLQAAIAHVAPAGLLAEMHRRMAEPGSAA